MSNFLWDNTALPGTKSDTKPPLRPSTELSANEINTIVAGLADIRGAFHDGSTGPRSVMSYGAIGDNGITDDTAAIQAAIDDNKGGVVHFPHGKTFLCAGLKLDDSSYNGTTLVGPGTIKLKPDGGGTNVGMPAWVGILIKQCSGVTIAGLNFDGNRAAMTHTEFKFLIGIAGASNTTILDVNMKEVRGDGVFIGGSDWVTPPGTVPVNTRIINLNVSNTADDGRQAISVTTCDGLYISNITSYQVGTGVADGSGAGTTEPGGIDIEPDIGAQYVRNVVIDGANITTAGTSGFAIVGKSILGDDTARDWNVTNVDVRNVQVKRTLFPSAAVIQRCRDVSLDCSLYGTTNYTVSGWFIGLADVVSGALRANHVAIGVQVGEGEVRDSNLKIEVADYSLAGLLTQSVKRCTFELGSGLSDAGGFGPFALWFSNGGKLGIAQTDCKYILHAPYDGILVRGVRNEPSSAIPTFTRCEVQGDLSNYPAYANMWDTAASGANWTAGTYAVGATVNHDTGKSYICATGGTSVSGPTGTGTNISDGGTARWNYLGTVGSGYYPMPFRRNLIGLEDTAAPASGLWQKGEFLRNNGDPGTDCLYGWLRATTGTGNTAGTDWYALQFPVYNGNGKFTASGADGNALLRMGNGSVNSLGFYAAGDVGRVFGGGSAHGLIIYADRQGGSGAGLIQIIANDGGAVDSFVFDTTNNWFMSLARASFGKNADDGTNALQVYGGSSFKNSAGTELAKIDGTTGGGTFPELDLTTVRPTAVDAGPGFGGLYYNGRILDGWVAFFLDYHEWTAAAASQTISLCTLPGGSRILAVICETDNAYTGLAGTTALKIGLTSGGSELILSHDVKSAPVNKGLLDADLGASISRAGAVQGGAWVSYSGPGDVFVTMTSGTGNLGNGTASNLGAGASIIYLKVETIV